MKQLFLITLLFSALTSTAGNKIHAGSAQGPDAEAGASQTIYLTQTSTVILNGSASSSGTYQWTEVSTDYSSSANITSPNSAVTTVTGLTQGVWYFQLAVTNGGQTSTSVVLINVDYDVPPGNGTLIKELSIPGIASIANNRSNTTDYLGYTAANDYYDPNWGEIWMERGRSNEMSVDNSNGKFYATIEDGYQWNYSGYARSELHFANETVDISKTYMVEWKGYFPQSDDVVKGDFTTIWQLHGNDGLSPVFQLMYSKASGTIKFVETNSSNDPTASTSVINYSDLYNSAHTIRITFKEGYDGTGAFVKVEVDGVQKYYRNTGDVGRTWNQDWPKFSGVYDWGNNVVDPYNYSRNRKFSLVTESFKEFVLSQNQAPTANAGANQTIVLPIDNVELSGSGNSTNSSISGFQWTQVSGPSTATIDDPYSASTNVTDLVQGVYTFQLQVTDNNGATKTATMQVTVAQLANNAPTAQAGGDQTITLPTNSVSITGNGTDTDGSISSYSWTKISGPSGSIIVTPNSASTSVSGLKAGVYKFQLQVTDNEGATGTSTMKVTVNSAPNIAPIAKTSADQTITLPTNSVSISGSGSDIDGNIISYLWSKKTGPSGSVIGKTTSPTTVISNLTTGVYQFALTVTDNQGATGTATIQITVNPANNIPPVAHAGSNQTVTLPTSNVTLSGSGTDADGTISSYSWSKINGPSGTSISLPSSSSTTINGLSEGDYTFELTVTDNQGATGTDTVDIKVNPAINIPPVANAGSNQMVTLPTSNVTLSGSGTDADGTIQSYSWSKITGPSGNIIVNPNSANTVVSAMVQGVYQFELTVTDNKGGIGKDTIQVNVNAANNISPIAHAGSNQTVTLPTSNVTLSGSGTDADGTISSYSWSKITGPSGNIIVNNSSASTIVSTLVQGVYQFELTVTDNKGGIGKDTIQVNVNAANNISPIAHAGSNQTVTLPTSNVTLSGSGTDADGTIQSYSWSKITGPSGNIIVNPNSANTVVSAMVQGVYQFELTVTDNKGDVGKDTIQVKVNPAINIPPVANAGSNQMVTLPTSNVTLSGSGTDADGTIKSYSWSKITGPSGNIIVNSYSANTVVSGLVQGVYQFALTVTDNQGATGTATIQITVNPANNIPPVAHAGSNQTVTLPTSNVTLSGSGTDADGTISSYSWSKINGPSGMSISLPSSSSTTINGLSEGDYTIELTVTDNQGATGTDTVHIKVNPAINIPPVANAGTNQTILLPTDDVTLRGSGTDADGTIKSYAWSKITGPSGNTIVNPNSANTVVSGLVEGEYQFELTVTDNKGGIGKDTIQVNVNAANNIPPIAHAGSNQTVTLPSSNVTLSGSGTDADGTIKSYSWSKITGPSGSTIVNPASANTVVSNLSNGVYQYELTVTDNKGDVGKDTIQVKVNPAINIPPVANAGSNQMVTLPTSNVTLSGSGTDADGTIKSYSWSKITGPSGNIIVNSYSANTVVSGLVQGVYQFALTVTDNQGATGTATIQITVNPANNIPPVAHAGSNQTVTLPTSNVTLSGSGTDADGTISSYSWSKINGPSGMSISLPSSSSTTINGLSEGDYTIELTVTDNQGATGTDTVHIKVNPAINIPPVANAGTNQTILLPTDDVTLRGSGTDADGTIKSYAWSKITGPSGNTIVNPNSANTVVSGLVEGEYQFELTVTDNEGGIGKDIIEVKVNGFIPSQQTKVSTVPKANAGNDITTVASNNPVTLKGSGSDSDGSMLTYSWKQISGPSSSTIISSDSAITEVQNLIEGTYGFELQVKGVGGEEAKDTMQVTVGLERLAPENFTGNLKVYPNPVHTVANVEVTTGKNNTNVMMIITDMSGKIVYKNQFVSSSMNVKQEINMSNLIKGVYTISVYFDGMIKSSVKVIRL